MLTSWPQMKTQDSLGFLFAVFVICIFFVQLFVDAYQIFLLFIATPVDAVLKSAAGQLFFQVRFLSCVGELAPIKLFIDRQTDT